MHIIIGVLTGILTIMYLLDRIGIDIGWLNPFHWRHRRRWANKFEADPIFAVEDPMQIAALLVVGATRLDGEISAGQKQVVLRQFAQSFSLDEKSSSELYISAAHLLGTPQLIGDQLDGLVSRNTETFSPEQLDSMMQMLVKVASADGSLSSKQEDYIDLLRKRLGQPVKEQGTWA